MTRVKPAAFSGDGTKIVTASWDKTARLWDAASGREIAKLVSHDGGCYTPPSAQTDAHRQVSRRGPCGSGTPRAGAKSLLKGHAGMVFSAAFSADGKQVVRVRKIKPRGFRT